MLSTLNTALKQDRVDVVIKKIQQGTYILPTLMRAIKWKAWGTTSWILTMHPNIVNANLFRDCSIYPLKLSHDTVRSIAESQFRTDVLAHWLRAMVAWEHKHGPIFTVEQFAQKWKSLASAHWVRKSMTQLAEHHRFDVVSLWWEDIEKNSVPRSWFNSMWRNVLGTMDSELLHWLLERSSLAETLEHCRSAINFVKLSLLHDSHPQENANWFWQELLKTLNVEPVQMLSYIASYDRLAIRTLWSLFRHVEHSDEWVHYFEARCVGQHMLCPNPLVDILHSLYTDNILKLNHLTDTFRLNSDIVVDTSFCI